MSRCTINITRFLFSCRSIVMWLLLGLGYVLPASANDNDNDEDPKFEETSIMVTLQGIGSTEVPAVIDEETAYLSITDIFNFLKVRNQLSDSRDTVSGFFITEDATFLIDRKKNRIQFRDKVFNLEPEVLVKTETGLYLRTDYFNKVFDFDCQFNFRSLSINIVSNVELPAAREMRQQLMYQNLSRLKGTVRADTTIGRSKALFKFGMANWSVVSTQRLRNVNDTWFNLTMGGTFAGGEATVSLNYNNYAQQQLLPTHPDSNIVRPFDQRQQYYRLRFVNNDRPWLRQVIAGKIFTPTIASLFAPVVGVQVTNTPTTYRRSYGSYTLSNFTDPGWTVELYINNALVDYTVADAAGFYTFQVPLVYGNSQIKLRFYGPWGEERFLEENINIPFNFLPKGEFEYTASAGVAEDTVNSKLGRVQFNYGATNNITVGAGVEYLSSIRGANTLPFVTTSMRIASNLLFSGEYTYGVRARGILSYRSRSNLQAEMQYTRYKKDQKAIIYNWLEERKVMVAKPFMTKNFSLFSRLTLNQIILPGSYYTTTEWLMSGAIFRVGTSLSTNAIFIKDEDPFVYSNLALTFRIPWNILLTPQTQYEYNTHRFMAVRCEAGKYLFRNGYLNVSYEKNYRNGITNYGIGLRYDFSFSQIGFSIWKNNNLTTLVESAKGSIILDSKSGYTGANSRSSVGSGGVVFVPFLDLNNNERYDKGEPRVDGLQLKQSTGRMIRSLRDTSIAILDMEPYSTYLFELESKGFESISWQIRKPAIKVIIEPNQLRRIDVPISVLGEVSGIVYLQEDSLRKEQGGIKICIYKSDSTLVKCILTESDGYFNYMGLAPGGYVIQPDPAQLKKLKLKTLQPAYDLHIGNKREGDVIDDIEFILEKK
ncbi:hypothetical protein [Chitinophaga filiformis]|uniref:Outer membrane usher protein FimD/PapC n=1 Tax=Chitinophaga filiformis TaxID=104663 RepID=A0A1G7N4H9_CHIFI|nr:hypothetical protein [Chitinophaga filiformis]SDF68240.1 hypothetical protein SAMN04488121_102646 [Chitinophaga filiformis]